MLVRLRNSQSRVVVVSAEVPEDVSDHHVPLLVDSFSVRLECSGGKLLQEEGDPAALQVLPEEVGEVAEEGLEEEYEDDPLVPGVPDLVPVLGHLHQIGVVAGVRSDPRVREVHANLAG